MLVSEKLSSTLLSLLVVQVTHVFHCSIHHVHRDYFSFLRRSSRVFRWTRVCTNNILCKSHSRIFRVFHITSHFWHAFLFLRVLQLPCVIWLIVMKPRRYSLSWWINWVRKTWPQLHFFLEFWNRFSIDLTRVSFPFSQFCIVVGVLLMVLAPIGGMRQIIIQAKDYQFYS